MTERPSLRRFVAGLVLLCAFILAVGFVAASVVRQRVDMQDARSERASEERSQLLDIVIDLRAQLAAERAEDQSEFEQDRCEDAYRRAVERAEAAEASAVLVAIRALDTPGEDAAVAAYEETERALSAAVTAQDGYVRDGRPLPCPIGPGG